MKHMDGLDLSHFSSPQSVATLFSSRCKGLPTGGGVYVVLNSEPAPDFVETSAAGWYKDRDPSYPANVVRENWVEGAWVVYVGMTASKRGLRDRIRRLVDFGHGKPVAHRGGRMLWHLRNWQDLQVCWRECPRGDARKREYTLIGLFTAQHGKRPFANMQG